MQQFSLWFQMTTTTSHLFCNSELCVYVHTVLLAQKTIFRISDKIVNIYGKCVFDGFRQTWFQKHDVYTGHRCLLITLWCDNSQKILVGLVFLSTIFMPMHMYVHAQSHIHIHINSLVFAFLVRLQFVLLHLNAFTVIVCDVVLKSRWDTTACMAVQKIFTIQSQSRNLITTTHICIWVTI